MLRVIYIFIFIFSFFPSWGEENQTKKLGYRYIIDNYFSKRQASGVYQDYSKSFTLYSGMSFYRESTERSFKPFSSFVLGFNRRLKEIPQLGDLNLQAAVISSQMATHRAVLLEITPRLTIPEIRTAFPLYVGAGLGLGFYPRYIIREQPFLSVNSQFFIGLRFFDLYYNLGFSAELNLKIHSPFSESEIYLETLGRMGLIFRF